MHKLDTVIKSEIGKILRIDDSIVRSILFTKKGDEHEVHSIKSFYVEPKIRDYFLYEEGTLNNKEAVLIERAILIGIIEKCEEPLVTLNLDKKFEQKCPDFNYQQHSEELYANHWLKPKKGQVVVLREGVITIEDGDFIKFAYRNSQTLREIYLEKPNIRDLKEYIQSL